ncbi:MAG: hypothetical protein DRN05_02905 [Thermoplasmata archaeon]|nr:MAG: hypothetical protein DRN05_02905 [Thermoplasmata archaeon]
MKSKKFRITVINSVLLKKICEIEHQLQYFAFGMHFFHTKKMIFKPLQKNMQKKEKKMGF